MSLFLIIDDSMVQRVWIVEKLQNDGHQVIEATSGSQGIEMAISNSPDYILLDIIMPDMDGLEVIQELDNLNLEIPVIVLTAHIQESTKNTCLVLGVIGFLNKPLNIDELHEVIKKNSESKP